MKEIKAIVLTREDIEKILKKKFGGKKVTFSFGTKSIFNDFRDPPKIKPFLKGAVVR